MITRRNLISTTVAAATALATEPGAAQATKPFIAQAAHLHVQVPSHWTNRPSLPGGLQAIGADDGYFVAYPLTNNGLDSGFASQSSVTKAAETPLPAAMRSMGATRYDVVPTDGSPVSMAITLPNPHPILVYAGEADRLLVMGDATHFDAIISTIQFGLEGVSATSLANSIIDIVEAHSWFREFVDWAVLRAQAEGIEFQSEIDGFLRYRVLPALYDAGDNHSFIRNLDGVVNIATPTINGQLENMPAGEILNGYGYLSFPGHNSFAPDYAEKYARKGSELRNEFAETGVCGWIIDMRGMGGGSVSPVLSVIYPFLPDGRLAGFLDAWGNELWIEKHGEEITPAAYQIAMPGLGWPPGLDDPSVPVAVLTGRGNGSAGEFVQLALMARENLVTFGNWTAGYTTGNASFPLFNGSAFALATSAELDVHGGVNTGSIAPDVLDPSIGVAGELSYDVLAPVYDWLGTHCS